MSSCALHARGEAMYAGRASRMVRAGRISRMDALAEAAIDESP
jgi:hypothetical protein